MPRTAGKMGSSGFRSWNGHTKLQNQGPQKMAKFISWAAPIFIFVFFGVTPRFHKKRVFENRPIFAETTGNIVPNGRGCTRNFCTGGSEISHVRSGSNMVPKNIFSHLHLLFHSPSSPQGELFHFLAFSLLDNTSLSMFLIIAFWLCNKYLSFSILVLLIFCCSCWLCLFAFFGWCLCF